MRNQQKERCMAEIVVIKDGPLHITGVTNMQKSDGSAIDSDDEVWLCRCGHSKKKPFCDGTHKKIGFSDET